MQESIFDTEADRYEEWFGKNNFLLQSELEAIRQLLPAFEKGIEIGVRTGNFAAQLGIKDGVEPSPGMGEKAAAKGIRVLRTSAERLPIDSGVYQLALMVTVDCFLTDVLQAFKEAHRILSDGGSFIVAFIDRETPLGQVYVGKKESNEFYQQASFHSAAEIKALLEEAGFSVTEKRQTIFTLENKPQDIRDGTGTGVFAVIKAIKPPSGFGETL